MIVKANHVSDLIKRRIEFLGLNQTKLSNNLGWKNNNSQQLSNIILGKCQLPPKHIKRLSQEIKVNESIVVEAMANDYRLALLNTIDYSQLNPEIL
jgi:antitoxin component HigA of HigAB toxin-antitoxin module